MILEAKNLTKTFKEKGVKAVDDISFSVEAGKTLGIVGESGSGKSTLVKLVLQLMKADEGDVYFHEKRLAGATRQELKDFYRRVQVVFQEPFLSLDPRMSVEEILSEAILIHSLGSPASRSGFIDELLFSVELHPGLRRRRPRELSGGECQRIAIARAISTNPELIVCDEALSSLDVLVQIQILNLLLRLQNEKGLAYLFISHDLRMVHHMSDSLLVMKDGKVCESGTSQTIFESPKHPYTQALLQKIRIS